MPIGCIGPQAIVEPFEVAFLRKWRFSLPMLARERHVSENEFDPVLEELKKRSIDRLLGADTFDASAFEAFKTHLWRKAEGLQREYCISKQILLSLRSATSAIRSRAE